MIQYLIDRDHVEGGAEGALVKKYLSCPCPFSQSSCVCLYPTQPFPPLLKNFLLKPRFLRSAIKKNKTSIFGCHFLL